MALELKKSLYDYFLKPTEYKTAYNNSMKAKDVPHLIGCSLIYQYMGKGYYPGACEYCCALTSKSQPLMRCSGCHLVYYCDKSCQRNDWKKHKILFCKSFQVKNGKNALMFDDETRQDHKKWTNALKELQKKAVSMWENNDVIGILGPSNIFLSTIFSGFSRVCIICKNAKQNKLYDCSCCCVAYCCKAHEQEDNFHKPFCKEMSMFPLVDSVINKEKKWKFPSILKNTLQTQFEPIDDNHFNKMELNILREYEKDHKDLALIPPSSFSRFDLLFAVLTNHLAFPLTVLFNLQEFGIGKVGKPIQSVSSLNVHIVTRIPVFDSCVWEYFMHLLPALMELNITFIAPKIVYISWTEYIDYQGIDFERCKDCQKKGRIINYSVHRNDYHMFFSSEEYTEPDVVAVFGMVEPLFLTKEEQEHSEISYRDMTHSNETLFILTEVHEEVLKKGIKHVLFASPTLRMVLPPTTNPMAGYLGARGTGLLSFPVKKSFVCCLRNP